MHTWFCVTQLRQVALRHTTAQLVATEPAYQLLVAGSGDGDRPQPA